MSNICWFQLRTSEDLLIFFVTDESKWRIFGFFWLDKKIIWRWDFGFWEIVKSTFPFFFFVNFMAKPEVPTDIWLDGKKLECNGGAYCIVWQKHV